MWVKRLNAVLVSLAAWLAEGQGEMTRTMARDDDEPIRKRHRLEPLVLDSLGVTELRDYITELRQEIVRVEADIARKDGHRSAADAFFRPRQA
jgi:uncharacterized small protein (DUF1192 family)